MIATVKVEIPDGQDCIGCNFLVSPYCRLFNYQHLKYHADPCKIEPNMPLVFLKCEECKELNKKP